MADRSAADELAALARALRAHTRRRLSLGERVTIVPAAAPSASAARRPAALSQPASESAAQQFPPNARSSAVAARAPGLAPGLSASRAAGARTAFSGSEHGQIEGPARSSADVHAQAKAATSLEDLRTKVASCTACDLCKTRKQTVFMDGQGTRGLLFVGEAPGADEDSQGVPFVGRSGQLLTDIITKGMGIARSEVWIANILKCRPPDNREPTPVEKEICTPWLQRQIEFMNPRLIIALGKHAASHLLSVQAKMSDLRGQVHTAGGRQIIATFHPAYLLRSPGEKKECWKDIQRAMGILGIANPKASGSGS